MYIIRRVGTGWRLGHSRSNCRGRGNQRFPPLVPSDVARVHDPPCFCVHDFETVTPVVIAEIEETKLARLAVQFALPRDAMVRRFAERQDRHRRAAPEEYLVRGEHAAVRLSRGAVESFRGPQDTIHKLESSESRIPLSISRCTFAKSLLTSMRATCPALIARECSLSAGPFSCGVYGAVSSRRIWRLLQYSTNAELVYSAPLSVRNTRGIPMSATNRCTTPRMADALLSRVPYGRWK